MKKLKPLQKFIILLAVISLIVLWILPPERYVSDSRRKVDSGRVIWLSLAIILAALTLVYIDSKINKRWMQIIWVALIVAFFAVLISSVIDLNKRSKQKHLKTKINVSSWM